MILVGPPPLIYSKPRSLVLGTFPSQMFLDLKQYYADPRNEFWSIIERVFEVSRAEAYHTRTGCLLENGVDLWDALYSCERDGSLDEKICNGKPNELRSFLEDH